MSRWTNQEIERLRRCYPVMTREQLAVAFPRHPITSILSTAHDFHIRKSHGSRKWLAVIAGHVPFFNFRRTS
jgi:hypothetical protein